MDTRIIVVRYLPVCIWRLEINNLISISHSNAPVPAPVSDDTGMKLIKFAFKML
jgi:hypothetical protein